MRILLIRHAKSSWKYPQLADHERPLNKRGKRDVVTMVERLLKLQTSIQTVYSSSAVRAQLYAKAIADAFAAELYIEEPLYTFSGAALLRHIHQVYDSDNQQVVAFVGHNPAIMEVASTLGNGSIVHFPTSAVLALDMPRDSLSSGRPAYWEYPKKKKM